MFTGNPQSLPRRRAWGAYLAVIIAALFCLTALLFRAPLLARYWAWRVAHTSSVTERAAYIGALCRAGAAAQWGAAALLAHGDPDVRQYGIVLLQGLKTSWARERLLDHMTDPDANVRHLAAVGLALRGDAAVLPTLQRLYQGGDVPAARTACVALEYLGTSEAMRVLEELAAEPAEAERRAALVDALAGIARAGCVPGLVRLLSDERVCDVSSPTEEAGRRVWDGVQAEGYFAAVASLPASQPGGQTIAERAAAALGRITGLHGTNWASRSPAERAAAGQQWLEWYARRADGE